MKENIYIVSGFSGAGKSSLLKEALKNTENVELIKSYTTREPRDEKDDGYHFIEKETFRQMERNGEFLETNFYGGNYYGTPLGDVKRCLGKGKSPVLEIDPNGYRKILDCGLFENICSLFVAAQADEISRRLCTRGTEGMEKIMKRMQTAVEECEKLDFYDVILENKDYLESIRKITSFLQGEKVSADEFDTAYFVKEAEFLLYAYRRGIALQDNEYTRLQAYYEDRNMTDAQLAVLGAAFARELISMSNHAGFGTVMTLLNIAVVLKRTRHTYNAEKIFKIAENWAVEEQMTGSAQYPHLKQCIEEVRDFLEIDKKDS